MFKEIQNQINKSRKTEKILADEKKSAVEKKDIQEKQKIIDIKKGLESNHFLILNNFATFTNSIDIEAIFKELTKLLKGASDLDKYKSYDIEHKFHIDIKLNYLYPNSSMFITSIFLKIVLVFYYICIDKKEFQK